MSTALQPLWEIEQELMILLDCIATCETEMQPELQGRIERYLAREAAKVDQIAHVLSGLDYEQRAAQDEIVRLQERKKSAKAAQERLEAYVCRVIQMRQVKKLAGNTNTLSVRQSDAVVITDQAAVPEEFQTLSAEFPYTPYRAGELAQVYGAGNFTVTCDKNAIKKALKAGREVPGADLQFHDNLMRK
jgi:hypothetical protein